METPWFSHQNTKFCFKRLGSECPRKAFPFNAAKGRCLILRFDEADALFGKRTEIKDSHDRYTSIPVNRIPSADRKLIKFK